MTTVDDPHGLIAWARRNQPPRRPGDAITRTEHDQIAATSDRPLTQSPIMRHRHGTSAHNETGHML